MTKPKPLKIVRLSHCFVCLLLRIRSILNWSTDLDTARQDTTEAPGAVRIIQLTTTSQKQTTCCFLYVCLRVQCSGEYNKHCEHRDGSLLALLRQGHGEGDLSFRRSSRVESSRFSSLACLFIKLVFFARYMAACASVAHESSAAAKGRRNFFLFSSCSTSSISTLDRCCVYSL